MSNTQGPTPAFSWGEYVARLAGEHGSLAALAVKLALAEGVDANAASVERALRRLRTKTHEDGGQCGRWLLRAFGMPRDVEERAKWMGVFELLSHSTKYQRRNSLPFRITRCDAKPPHPASFGLDRGGMLERQHEQSVRRPWRG